MKNKKTQLHIRKKHTMTKSKLSFALIFGLPTLVLYIVFCVYPIINSVYTSFFKWSGFGDKEFIGLKNYISILKDEIFLKAIKNDFKIVLGKEVLIIVLTVLFAVSLTKLKLKKVEVKAYRFIYYIPNMLSTIIIGTLWAFIYDPRMGILNGMLEALNLDSIIPRDGWLVTYPLQSITVVASWCGIGFFMIVMISAINGVSTELYEAAKIDGAGDWKQLWYVTMPSVRHQVRFMVVTILYQSLGGNFGLVLPLVGNGGVNGSAMVMGLYVYNSSINSMTPKVGYSYAAATVMLIITSIVSLIVNGIMTKEDD